MTSALKTIVDQEEGVELYYEQKIIKLLTDRILNIGFPHYGEMTCNLDLDFYQETLEEVIDSMVYIALQIMKLQKMEKVRENVKKEVINRSDEPKFVC